MHEQIVKLISDPFSTYFHTKISTIGMTRNVLNPVLPILYNHRCVVCTCLGFSSLRIGVCATPASFAGSGCGRGFPAVVRCCGSFCASRDVAGGGAWAPRAVDDGFSSDGCLFFGCSMVFCPSSGGFALFFRLNTSHWLFSPERVAFSQIK
jgi:hypothetical protein